MLCCCFNLLIVLIIRCYALIGMIALRLASCLWLLQSVVLVGASWCACMFAIILYLLFEFVLCFVLNLWLAITYGFWCVLSICL